jgi:hypothetical protein
VTALADLHEFVNRATGGNSGAPEYISWRKVARVAGAAAATPIAGQRTSMWEYEGSPSHGAVPAGSAVYPDNTTAGGLQQTDPGGGRQKWLASALVASTAPCSVKGYDRIAQFGGLSSTVTTAQTVNLTPTRYTNGLGNRIYVEINTQIGATGTTITAAYHNQANASKTTQAVTFGATNNREAQRWIELSLAAGDTGVISVESVTVLASTTTAGAFSVVIGHPLETFCCTSLGVADCKSYLDGFKEILTDACLSFWFLPSGATVPDFDGDIFMLER